MFAIGPVVVVWLTQDVHILLWGIASGHVLMLF